MQNLSQPLAVSKVRVIMGKRHTSTPATSKSKCKEESIFIHK